MLVEQLGAGEQLQSLVQSLQHNQLTARSVDLSSGQVTLRPASAEQDFVYANDQVTKIFGPRWDMLLIGAGQLSRYVCQIALMLGYRVIVCDPRQEYSQNWDVPGTEFTRQMPDEAVQQYAQQPRSIVMALTHDPKLDDMALLEALQSPAFYVGAIGSRRNCESRRKRLKDLGITAVQLQRLHAPIGLPIGSRTPPEIAVSILAQITQQRNSVSEPAKQSVRLA